MRVLWRGLVVSGEVIWRNCSDILSKSSIFAPKCAATRKINVASATREHTLLKQLILAMVCAAVQRYMDCSVIQKQQKTQAHGHTGQQ